jgi:DNA-directed RNA polymerase specialized sigma subunit
MWKTYRGIIRQYTRLSLREERQLIRKAKRGSKQAADELVLRHIGFVIFRIHKRAFPAYARRFGEDILSHAIVLMYAKIQTYNLRYYDKDGKFKPVRFVSYIWKFIDGLILAALRKEFLHEKQRVIGCREGEEYDIFEQIPAGN